MALSDTLRQFRERQERDEQIAQDAPRWREEWQNAVRELLTRIRGYLAEYEEQRLLSFSETSISLNEEAIGKYDVPSLKIQAFRALLIVQPVASMVVGGLGRVDIHRQGRSGDQDRAILLRRKTGEEYRWDISMPASRNPLVGIMQMTNVIGTGRQYEVLSKESLERAIDILLK